MRVTTFVIYVKNATSGEEKSITARATSDTKARDKAEKIPSIANGTWKITSLRAL